VAQHPGRHARPPAHRRPPLAGARRALSVFGLARRVRAAGLARPAAGALALILVGLLAAGTVAAHLDERGPLVRLDADVTRSLRDAAREPWTTIVTAITHLGGAPALCAVTAAAAVVSLRRGRRAEAVLVVAALATSQLLTLALKAAFDRPRPVLPDPLATASWLSFPSGHASGATAVYGAVALLAARRVRTAAGRASIIAGWAVLVALIAFSRVYLGVHHLSDVVAGIGVGAVCLGVVLLAELAHRAGRSAEGRDDHQHRVADGAAGRHERDRE